MEYGTICKVNYRKAFGFIATNDGDIFFHASGLLNRQISELPTGCEVTFRRAVDPMHGKPIALDVRVVEP